MVLSAILFARISLIGNVEVRYDEIQKRVIYEPVTSVEPRDSAEKPSDDSAAGLRRAGGKKHASAAPAPGKTT